MAKLLRLRSIFLTVSVILSLFFVTIIGLYFFQERLIFLPKPLEKDYSFQYEDHFEEHFIKMSDGIELNALHFTRPNPKGVILYFHGNADNLKRWGEITAYLRSFNHDMLLFDYRNYGKSGGEYNEDRMYQDAIELYNWINKKYPENSIILYGRSLGSTFATYVASRANPNSLILETPFYGLKKLVDKKFHLFPYEELLNYNFPSYQYAKEVNCRVLIFHGTKDVIVPYQQGLDLHHSFKDEISTLITIDDGRHNDLINYPEYKNEISRFLSE